MSQPAEDPTSERLAAFADGELGRCERARVAARLKTDPAAAAEVESLRRLADACRATVPLDPPAAAWDSVLARVVAALPAPAAARPRPRRRFPLRRVAGLAAAAAAAVVVFLGRPAAPVSTLTSAAEEPFPVATADDVTVVRIGAADARALVVGQPPVEGPLDWATHDDIAVVAVERFEGRAPDMHVDGSAPMLVAPSPPDEKAP